jgi:hypothetical protein
MALGKVGRFFSMLTPLGKAIFLITVISISSITIYYIIPPIHWDGICANKETVYNSPDCAIRTTISGIYNQQDNELDGKWVVFEAANVAINSSATNSVLLTEDNTAHHYFFVDGSGNVVSGYIAKYLLDGDLSDIPKFYGKKLEVRCKVETIIDILTWYSCLPFDDIINQITVLGDADSGFYRTAEVDASGMFADSYVEFGLNVTEIYEAIHVMKYNSTHGYWESLLDDENGFYMLTYNSMYPESDFDVYRITLLSSDSVRVRLFSEWRPLDQYLNPPYTAVVKGVAWNPGEGFSSVVAMPEGQTPYSVITV